MLKTPGRTARPPWSCRCWTSRASPAAASTWSPVRVDLRDVVREVLDRFALEIRAAACHRHGRCAGAGRGIWDAARVDQVVTNLLSNALKYGAGRPIEISVRGDASHGVFIVRDHGVGIPDDEQTKVFGPFARATTAKHHAGPRPGPVDRRSRSCRRAAAASPWRAGWTKGRRLPWSCRGDARLPLMIIDDDDDLRNALAFIMTSHGYEVAAFGDARARPSARSRADRAVSHPARPDDGRHVGLGVPRRTAREPDAHRRFRSSS